MFDQPKPVFIVTTDNAVSPEGKALMESIADEVRVAGLRQVAKVEQLLLEGHNEVTVEGVGRKPIIYTVPAWHKAPRDRLRVEWRRWRWRRSR